MNIQQNVSLKLHSTMRLGGNAAYYTEVSDRHELQEVMQWADQYKLPVIMIGSGSNIVWKDEGFPGLVIVNRISRFEEQFEDQENYYMTVGAGDGWDSVVAAAVERGMTGIEALSLIPGTAGATPVQNVGAYGQEIKDTLVSVEVYDKQEKRFSNLLNIDCGFSYRNSRFKSGPDRGRFFITAITLHLIHGNPQPPFYKAVQGYFDEHQITNPTPQVVRDAVIAIRQSKLPDPAQVANNGSFFANPIVDGGTYAQLQADFTGIPGWPMDDGNVKIPAAWLLEQAGFKGVHDAETGMATWPMQPLVLVNEKAQNTAQLLQFRQKIIDTINQKFGVTLEQEPELLP
jgi:UDP-N-acetylmuramate dehydrogenase